MESHTLSTVPREVYLMIVQSLSRPQDLNSLCQVSKRLYTETVPYLYRSIHLCASDIRKDNLTSLFRLAGERRLLRHTRHVKLCPGLYIPARHQCLHRKRYRYHLRDDGGFDEEEWDPVAQLHTVLGNCEPGALSSLDWELGICMPPSLWGPDGYFAREQHGLESIRLVTDGRCGFGVPHEPSAPHERSLGLTSFRRLKRFSWTGPTSRADLDSLAEILSLRCGQLERLEIDLTQHRDLVRGDPSSPDSDRRAGSALRLLRLPGRGAAKFPVLRELTLVAVTLELGETEAARRALLEDIRDALDFGALRSLTLRDCNGWEELTKLLTQHVEHVRLTSLEVQWSHNSGPLEPYEALLPFLQSFQGLEELLVHATVYTDSRPLWGAVLNHRDSLRKFAHHQRLQDQPDRTVVFEEACDAWDQSFRIPGGAEDDSLGRLDLTCLGLACSPRHLRCFVSGFAAKSSLWVLHVRQSGPDLGHYPGWAESADDDDPPFYLTTADFEGADFPALGTSFVEFAQWAFGPEGIRSLRLLAYGDFSYDGRFADSSLLFCRREGAGSDGGGGGEGGGFVNFREVREGDDWELWDLFENEKRFLAACPCDTLFHNIDT